MTLVKLTHFWVCGHEVKPGRKLYYSDGLLMGIYDGFEGNKIRCTDGSYRHENYVYVKTTIKPL